MNLRLVIISTMVPAAMNLQLAADTAHLASQQKKCWETYLSSGRGSEGLFKAIDVHDADRISVSDVHVFADSVDHKGVHPRAFRMLDELAHDHEITLAEFKSWLVLATQLGHHHHESCASYRLHYESHPDVGETKEALDDPSYHSWNEATMNQQIRRMQYAVRGSVVMRADALAAEGREILFTK